MISPKTALSMRLLILQTLLVRSTTASLSFYDDPDLVGIQSTLCVPLTSTALQSFPEVNSSFLVHPGQDICTATAESIAKYSGKTVIEQHVVEACGYGQPSLLRHRLKAVYDISAAVNVTAVITLYDGFNWKYTVPGYIEHIAAGIGIGSEVPYIWCKYPIGADGEPIAWGYISDLFKPELRRRVENMTAIRVRFNVDTNPWIVGFDSGMYEVLFQLILAPMYFITSLLALRYWVEPVFSDNGIAGCPPSVLV